jgi:hypothetical protein
MKIWLSLAMMAASIIVAFFAIQFLSGKLSVTSNAIVDDRATVQSETNALANLAQLEADAPQAMLYQAAMNQLLPDQYTLVTLPQWLAQLGGKDGVVVSAAFQGAPTLPSGETPGAAQFSFNAQGTPQNIATFLDDMNKKSVGFLVTLTSFGMTSDGLNENVTGQGTAFFH